MTAAAVVWSADTPVSRLTVNYDAARAVVLHYVRLFTNSKRTR